MLAHGQFQWIARGFPIAGMMTVRQIRHANLLLLINAAGSIQAFADKVERSHSQISQLHKQMLHSTTGKPRTVGDDLAREIEVKLGKPVGWLDQIHSDLSEVKTASAMSGIVQLDVVLTPAPAPMETQILADLAELLPEDVEEFAGKIHQRAEQMRRHKELVLRRAGVTTIATAAQVAHIPAAPPYDGPERRQADKPVEHDRRRERLDPYRPSGSMLGGQSNFGELENLAHPEKSKHGRKEGK